MSDGELREMRALLEAVIAAWREGWDCSANPWHEAVEQAVRNAEHALEEADAARPRGAEAVNVRLTAEQSEWLEHQAARARAARLERVEARLVGTCCGFFALGWAAGGVVAAVVGPLVACAAGGVLCVVMIVVWARR